MANTAQVAATAQIAAGYSDQHYRAAGDGAQQLTAPWNVWAGRETWGGYEGDWSASAAWDSAAGNVFAQNSM